MEASKFKLTVEEVLQPILFMNKTQLFHCMWIVAQSILLQMMFKTHKMPEEHLPGLKSDV